MPIEGGPTGRPFGEDVNPELRISVNFDGFFVGVFNSGDEGGALHADVGGGFIAAESDGPTGAVWGLFYHCEAAWTWVGFGAAVCP